MTQMGLIVALSTVLWYLIDRFKELWANFEYGKYITIVISAIGSFALTFCFNLDILNALELVPEITVAGRIVTGFLLMSGSSAISEIINRIKGE